MPLLALFFLPHAYLLLTHSSLNIHANSHSYPLSLPLSLPPSLSPSTSPLNQTEQVGTCRSELLWPATSAGVLPAPNTGDGPDHAGPGSGFQSVAFVAVSQLALPAPLPPSLPAAYSCRWVKMTLFDLLSIVPTSREHGIQSIMVFKDCFLLSFCPNL